MMDSTTLPDTAATPFEMYRGEVNIHNTLNNEITKVSRDFVDMFEVWSAQIQRWSQTSPDGCPTIKYNIIPELLNALIYLVKYRIIRKERLRLALRAEADYLHLRSETRIMISRKQGGDSFWQMKLVGDTYSVTVDYDGDGYKIYSEKFFRLATHESDMSCDRSNYEDPVLVISPAKEIYSRNTSPADGYNIQSVNVTVKFDSDGRPVVTFEYIKPKSR